MAQHGGIWNNLELFIKLNFLNSVNQIQLNSVQLLWNISCNNPLYISVISKHYKIKTQCYTKKHLPCPVMAKEYLYVGSDWEQ